MWQCVSNNCHGHSTAPACRPAKLAALLSLSAPACVATSAAPSAVLRYGSVRCSVAPCPASEWSNRGVLMLSGFLFGLLSGCCGWFGLGTRFGGVLVHFGEEHAFVGRNSTALENLGDGFAGGWQKRPQ